MCKCVFKLSCASVCLIYDVYVYVGRVNSQKKFIYTSNFNLNLRESRKTITKTQVLRKNSIWGKPRGGEGEFTIFRGLQ